MSHVRLIAVYLLLWQAVDTVQLNRASLAVSLRYQKSYSSPNIFITLAVVL